MSFRESVNSSNQSPREPAHQARRAVDSSQESYGSQTVNLEFVERYQSIYEKDPKSKVFAPLAEAYRQMGLIKEALELCEQGLAEHPQFASGQVTYARVLISSDRKEEAFEQLKQACTVAPENILAHRLLGELALERHQAKEALKAFKVVLLLAPQDEKAQEIVKKLESLTADEYEPELFSICSISDIDLEEPFHLKEDNNSQKPVGHQGPQESESLSFSEHEEGLLNDPATSSAFMNALASAQSMAWRSAVESSRLPDSTDVASLKKQISGNTSNQVQATPSDLQTQQSFSLKAHSSPSAEASSTKTLDRFVSLTDAYLARNDILKATEVLEQAKNLFGGRPEIQKRQKIIAQHSSPQHIQGQQSKKQVNKLQNVLTRIQSRRKDF